MKKSIQFIALVLAMCCAVFAQAAKPVFLIAPVTNAPSTIYAGQTVTTTYTVTNNTPYALDGNGVIELPTGVTQTGGSCNAPFNLASGASCTLTLQIVADTLRGDVRGGPKVCNTLSHPIYCSIPLLGNELNITKNNTLPPITLFTIGGTISGLTASGLVLRNNGGDDLPVPSGATSFEFATPVAYGGGYTVTVAAQPTGLTCTVSNGTGTNVTANVSNVSITCNTTTFTIGGTISGLTASGLVLRNNGGDDLPVPSGATSFEFATPVAYGGGYEVTVATQPAGPTCTVSNGMGTNVTANVTNVQITCTFVVGAAYGGGVIYRIDGNTAYILSLSDVSSSVSWGPFFDDVPTSQDNTFDNSDNTYSVLAGSNYPAAAACRNYTAGSGANTWFLPAKNEWPLIVADIITINSKSGTSGFTQFTAGEYWSSTQQTGNPNVSLTWLFSSASASAPDQHGKLNALRVRCVRALTI